MSPVLFRRATMGAGALLGVLLLVVAGAVVLSLYYAERADAERRAEDREAGRVFALWFAAAHRASLTNQAAFRVEQPDGSFVVTAQLLAPGAPVMVAAAPPGLPDTVGRSGAAQLSVGIIDDRSGVPMAFGVLEPQAWAHTGSLREGALEAGLAQIEVFPGSGSEMEVHEGAIRTVLGRMPATGALFVTADRGVRYSDRVLYRRAQPGQSRLNRMETDLNARGCGPDPDTDPQPCDVLNGGPVGAVEITVTPDALAPVASRVGGDGEAQRARVGTAASPSSLATLELRALEVSGAELTVNANLVVGSSRSDRVSTVGMEVSGHVQAGRVDATTLRAQDVAVTNVARVTGTSTVGMLSGSALTVTSGLGTREGTVEGLYGPSAYVGTLTVGSCAGCFPE